MIKMSSKLFLMKKTKVGHTLKISHPHFQGIPVQDVCLVSELILNKKLRCDSLRRINFDLGRDWRIGKLQLV